MLENGTHSTVAEIAAALASVFVSLIYTHYPCPRRRRLKQQHDPPRPTARAFHAAFQSGQGKRSSAIEPVIGHMKSESHLGRCYLKGTAGDAANAILTAVGHNLRLVLAWLRILLCLILAALRSALEDNPKLKLAS